MMLAMLIILFFVFMILGMPIAFTMGARGILLDKAEHFGGVIPLF